MSKTLLEQAIADANSISIAAEEVAKKKLLESLAPEIKRMVNQKLLMEDDDQSEEKQDDDLQAPDTIEKTPVAPEQELSAPAPVVSEPSQEAPVSEPAASEPMPEVPVSEPNEDPEPLEDLGSEDVETSPAPSSDPVPMDASSAPVDTTDVPMSDFDDELVIELKPIIDAEGGVQDLPVDEEQPSAEEEPTEEPTNEGEFDASLKEAFMKRNTIRSLLENIEELTSEEPVSLSDIPEDDARPTNEDINIYISDSSEEGGEAELGFLNDQSEDEEGEIMRTEEEAFVEEAVKLFRKQKAKKTAKKPARKGKGSIKEFYKPAEKGFRYGSEDTDPERDSNLFKIKKGTHFEKVLPPDVKKWIVEAHKALNVQGRKLNEQAILAHQLRLLVKGLTENNLGKKNFLNLVEALDNARSIKESNNTFIRFIKEDIETEEDPLMSLDGDKSEEKDDTIREANEAQKKKFMKLARING